MILTAGAKAIKGATKVAGDVPVEESSLKGLKIEPPKAAAPVYHEESSLSGLKAEEPIDTSPDIDMVPDEPRDILTDWTEFEQDYLKAVEEGTDTSEFAERAKRIEYPYSQELEYDALAAITDRDSIAAGNVRKQLPAMSTKEPQDLQHAYTNYRNALLNYANKETDSSMSVALLAEHKLVEVRARQPAAVKARKAFQKKYPNYQVDAGVPEDQVKVWDKAITQMADLLDVDADIFSHGGTMLIKPFSSNAYKIENGILLRDKSLGQFTPMNKAKQPTVTAGSVGAISDPSTTIAMHELFHGLDGAAWAMFHKDSNLKVGLKNGKPERLQAKGKVSYSDGTRMTSETPEDALPAMSSQMRKAWTTLRQDITAMESLRTNKAGKKEITSFYERSAEADRFRDPYWATNPEMLARAFETYMQWKKADKAGRSYKGRGVGVYPMGSEVEDLVDSFDAFFSAARTQTREVKGLDGKPLKIVIAVGGLAAVLPKATEAEAGGLLQNVNARNAALEEAAGDGLPAPAIEEGAPEGTPTIDNLSSEEQSEYAASDYDSVADYLASKK